MTVLEAIKQRIENLLKERGMTMYRLSMNSGVGHGALSGVMSLRNKALNFQTVIKIAGGFDMTVSAFLDDPIFNEDNLAL
jgi:transcriptional regulator with XRE-family HTH domain